VVPLRRRPLFWILLGGLLVRALAYPLVVARSVAGITVSYFQSAADLVGGDPFRVAEGTELLHPFGYSFIIAAVQSVTGANDAWTLLVVTLMQLALDVSAIYLAYVVGRNLHSRRTGMWVAAAYAVNPLIVLAALQPNPEALSPFLMTAVLASASMVGRDRRWWLWAGLACGIAAQFRSEFLPLVGGVVLYVVLIGAWRGQMLRMVAMLAVAAACMLPFVLGTWAETGTPRVSTTNGWATAWQGLGEKADNPWGLKLGDKYCYLEAERMGYPTPWGPEANEHFKQEFVAAVKEHPGYYAKLVLLKRIPDVFDTQKARYNYLEYAVGVGNMYAALDQYAVYRQEGIVSVVTEHPRLLVASNTAGLVLRASLWLSYAGLVLYVLVNIRKPRRWLLLTLPFAYIVLSLTVIKFVEPRQFFTLLPIYTIAVGAVAHQGWERLGRRSRAETDDDGTSHEPEPARV
jgi:4-amino-4-deoxy-L-arabinose transferase-like glycosyltransferase